MSQPIVSNAPGHVLTLLGLVIAGTAALSPLPVQANGVLNEAQPPIVAAGSNHPPVVDDAVFTLDRNAPPGTTVGTVVATDPDGDTPRFRLVAGNPEGVFVIGARTGVITLARALDVDSPDSIPLTVQVRDGHRGRDTATVTIRITGETAGDLETEFLRLVNAARATARRCGTQSHAAADPLVWDDDLEDAAQRHSDDMTANNFFSHTGSDGTTVGSRVTATGYAWRTVGENIAAGQPDPATVMDAWLASPGHCANIMNPNFEELGVAVSHGGDYGIYWTQVFASPR